MCQDCQEIEAACSESSEAWDQTVEYNSEETLLNSGIKGEKRLELLAGVLYKICIKCGERKEISEFHRSSSSKDGRKGYCKVCAKLYNQRRASSEFVLKYPKDREVSSGNKLCIHCLEIKRLDEFNHLSHSTDGYENVCRVCRILERSARAALVKPPEEIFPEGMKRCSICNNLLPLPDFRKKVGSKDGLDPRCRACIKNSVRSWVEKRRSEIVYPVEGSKICVRCLIDQEFGCFSKKIKNKDGLDVICKSCRSVEGKERWKRLNFSADLSGFKFCKNCERTLSATAFYIYKKHTDGLSSHCKKCTIKLSEVWFNKSLIRKAKKRLRSRLNDYVRRGFKVSNKAAISFLGCTMPEFLEYIEKQFYADVLRSGREMSWENYGHGDGTRGWDFEHIIPLAHIDVEDEAQLKRVCHFSNIRPMWGWENGEKRDSPPDNWDKEAWIREIENE